MKSQHLINVGLILDPMIIMRSQAKMSNKFLKIKKSKYEINSNFSFQFD